MPVAESTDPPFGDLLTANRAFAGRFDLAGFDGIARAGLGIVTCMDSRIDPLRMVGLRHGDAKIVRNPGGRVTEQALEALILGVHLLGVSRIMVVPHTRCAVASYTEAELRERVAAASGHDVSDYRFNVVDDQQTALQQDVARVREHPLMPPDLAVGGMIYDVDTGLLDHAVA
jgi:carbonic anhydrase